MAEQIRITGIWKDDGSYYYADESGTPRTGNMIPPEHLTAALVGCTGITMHATMNRMRIDHKGFRITGTARLAGDNPDRISRVELETSISGARMSDAQRARLLDLSQKYCFVTRTLKQGLDVDLKIDLE